MFVTRARALVRKSTGIIENGLKRLRYEFKGDEQCYRYLEAVPQLRKLFRSNPIQEFGCHKTADVQTFIAASDNIV
jgi:hypothetical protein